MHDIRNLEQGSQGTEYTSSIDCCIVQAANHKLQSTRSLVEGLTSPRGPINNIIGVKEER